MFLHGIKASSSTASAAIHVAIAEALNDFGADAKSVHIIVTSVYEIDGIWQAVVIVIVGPDLDKELEEELDTLKIKKRPDLGRHLEKEEEKGDFDDLMSDDTYSAHIHFPNEYESYMHAYEAFISKEIIQPKETDLTPDLYFHLIEDGSLWDTVQKHPLDIEFYEATHTAELQHRREEDGRKLQENIKKRELKPKRRYTLEDLKLMS